MSMKCIPNAVPPRPRTSLQDTSFPKRDPEPKPSCPLFPQPGPSQAPSCSCTCSGGFWKWNPSIGAFVSAPIFKGPLFGVWFGLVWFGFCFFSLFDIEFPLLVVETPNGLQRRCHPRDPFRNSGHNLGAKAPVPAGTPQSVPRQDTAVSSCGPHRNQGNAESWKTHRGGQKHRSQP